jgi:hypothetical protein
MNRQSVATFVIASFACASSSAVVAACTATSSSGAPQASSDSGAAVPPEDGAPSAQGDASPPTDAPVVADSGPTPHVDSGPRVDGGPPPPQDSGPGQDYLVVKIEGINVAPGQLGSSDLTTDSGESGVDIAINLDPAQSHFTQVDFVLPDKGEGTYVCGSLAPESWFPSISYTVADLTANPPKGMQWYSEVNDASCTIKLLHYDRQGYIEGEVHGDVKRAGDSNKHVDISFRLSRW